MQFRTSQREPLKASETPAVVLVASTLRAGGAERQLTQLANYFSARGMNVTVATFTRESTAADFYDLSQAVHRVHLGVELGFFRILGGVRALRALLHKTETPAVVSFCDASNAITWLACLSIRRSCVLGIRANPRETLQALRYPWKTLVLLAYRNCGALVVQTEGVAQWVRDNIGRHPIVIPNSLRSLPEAVETERQSTILSVGSLLEYKGHDLLLRAFSQIHLTHPEWKIIIVGEGPSRSRLMKLAVELGISDKLELPGLSKNVEDWYLKSGVFVLTSRQEGFPNVLIEAMAMGLPVISTACDFGPSELIVNRQNGLLICVDDQSALARDLEELIGNEGLRRELGANAQQIRIKLSEETVMRAWYAVIFKAPAVTAGLP